MSSDGKDRRTPAETPTLLLGPGVTFPLGERLRDVEGNTGLSDIGSDEGFFPPGVFSCVILQVQRKDDDCSRSALVTPFKCVGVHKNAQQPAPTQHVCSSTFHTLCMSVFYPILLRCSMHVDEFYTCFVVLFYDAFF